MASAMRVFSKFRSSDGRIKIATLSGVSVLVAVIALLVGVLPVFASQPGATGEGVNPVQVDWGGGSGACDDDLTPVDGGDDRGPSAAEHELHVNNPVPGTSTTYTGPDGTEITLTVDEDDEFFTFSIEAGTGMAAYDVVVNGGKKSNHYEYDGGPGIVPSDSHLSAPTKDNKNEVHKLSHVNICYDFNTQFECGVTEKREQAGLFTLAEVTIFANSLHDCEDKLGAFFVDNEADNPSVTVNFGTGGDVTAGRANYTKEFNSPGDFAPLQYDGPGEFVDLQWCTLRDKDSVKGDGEEFDDVLSGKYPSLDGVTDTLSGGTTVDATACKVYEEEDASGTQYTVVYFEFEDPQFR